MLAIQSSVLTAPSATVKMGVRGAGRFRAYPTSLNSRASSIRRVPFVPRASDDEAVTPSEAPGEGKRVRPGAVDKDGYSEGERLEPWKGECDFTLPPVPAPASRRIAQTLIRMSDYSHVYTHTRAYTHTHARTISTTKIYSIFVALLA